MSSHLVGLSVSRTTIVSFDATHCAARTIRTGGELLVRKKSSGKPNKKRKRSSAVPRREPSRLLGAAPTARDDELPEEEGELLVAAWQTSRSGARAGRGFHFQDAVSAWLAARIASGETDAHTITPEGLEDIVLEGSGVVHLQVKSRVAHLGGFSPRLASRHILDAWQGHRSGVRSDGRLIVVLERGIEGEDGLSSLDQCLAESIGTESVLREALAALAAERDLSPRDVGELLTVTTVLGTTWEELTDQTADSLASLVQLAPSALGLVGRHLRSLAADAADGNADTAYETRRSLTKTELVAEVSRFATHVDLDALEGALRDGVCDVFELREPVAADDRFYEGTATQPAHVAAGLVVPRPEVVAEVLAGLQEQSAVVITGPSGAGKSAVLWTVPLAAPGVLWFRVRRLEPSDVPALIRMARSHECAVSAPVGFLVDGAGVGDIRGWAQLRAEAASVPGLLLVGTARHEDLPTLGDLSGCATVSVHLSEAAADVIFAGLKRRGSTSAAHWREAYDRANGLTLEFTHLLTRGRRLGDVIHEQVRRRLDEGRLDEVDVLSLVSVADRWAASLASDKVAAACGSSALELRQAVVRLAEEHLLVERDGVMYGLHRLRSEAIAATIHEEPPPDLMTTVRRVLGLVSTPQLHRFVANLLIEEPSSAEVIIESAGSAAADIDRLTAILHGLRLVDFYELAKEWTAVAAKHEVPASSQPILFQFAAAGLTFPDLFPEPIRNACSEMSEMAGPSRAAKFAAAVGYNSIAKLLASCADPHAAAQLLSTLDGVGNEFTSAAEVTLVEGCSLGGALLACSIDELAICIGAARASDRQLAELIVELLGGEDEILRRLRQSNPWVTELDIRENEQEREDETDVEFVGYCRLLHVSDAQHGDARQRAVSFGGQLLRCLPNIESVDVQSLLPGGHELRIGDYTHGTSGLRRQYDHSTLTVSWNQARLRSAVTLLGAPDTERLAAARPLLDVAGDIVRKAGLALVLGHAANVDFAELEQSVNWLHDGAREMKPPLGAAEIADTAIGEEAPVPMADDLSGLLTDITGNILPRLAKRENYRALEAYIAETTIGRHLAAAIKEPWYLLGLDGYPESLDRLGDVLADVHAVVHELATDGADLAKVGRSARSGGRYAALHRSAETCRRSEQRRRQKRRDALQRVCRATGLRTGVLRPSTPALPSSSTSWAVTVDLESLADWPAAIEALSSELSVQQPLGETHVLVPLRAGRPVPSLAMSLIKTPLPAMNIDDLLPQLADPHPSSLADTFSEGLAAVQMLSGICDLPENQRTHVEVQHAAAGAVEEYERSHAGLLALGADPLTEELVSLLEALAVQVQAEVDGTHDGDTVASQVVAGVVQGSTGSVFNSIVGACCLALEWDVDPESAVALLQSA